MWSRLSFVVIAVFFVVMNVLLWRAEISGRNHVGSAVRPEVVLDKILTAPDASPLEIRRQGERLGGFRWVPTVNEVVLNRAAREGEEAYDEALEGRIEAVASYDVEVEGHIGMDARDRVGFRFDVSLGTNYGWQDLSLRVTARPHVWELKAFASERVVRLTTIEDRERVDRTLTFDELRSPATVAGRILGDGAALGPWIPGMLAGLLPLEQLKGLSASEGSNRASLDGLVEWRARSDTLKLGSVRVRGYRLEGTFLGRYEVKVFVNTLGEIVRVELPNEIVIVNEGLASL